MALLGELLLKKSAITPQQLRDGRERQKQLGGRLGTALLELGAIREETLLATLSEQLRVPIAGTEKLKGIPAEIVELLPGTLALRCEAIPFAESSSRVSVALLDTRDLTIQDELSFALGKKVDIHIANEARILEALETYYGQPCPMRFHSLIERMNRSTQRAASGPVERPPQPAARSAPRASSSSETSKKIARGPLRGTSQPHRSGPVSIPLSAEERQALAEGLGIAPPEEALTPAVTTLPRSLPEPATAVARFESTVEEPESPQAVGEALIEALESLFDRALLFQVRRGRVEGWLARGGGLDPDAFQSYAASLDEQSVFRDLASEDKLFTGALASLPAHLRLLDLWRGAPGEECVVAPVKVRNRLVTVLYGDRGARGLETLDLGLIERLTARAAEAYERCIVKKKDARG